MRLSCRISSAACGSETFDRMNPSSFSRCSSSLDSIASIFANSDTLYSNSKGSRFLLTVNANTFDAQLYEPRRVRRTGHRGLTYMSVKPGLAHLFFEG